MVETPIIEVAPRKAAGRAALAAAGAAVVTAALAARWPPGLLANVLGPPPLGAWLAAASILLAPAAGALVGRRAARAAPRLAGRAARTSLWTALAYLGTVTLPVVLLRVVEQGPVAFAFPFAILVNGLSVCLVLVPWAALPVVGAALLIERWTRPRAGYLAALERHA